MSALSHEWRTSVGSLYRIDFVHGPGDAALRAWARFAKWIRREFPRSTIRVDVGRIQPRDPRVCIIVESRP